ncbi:MAG TPA: hypothetical protein P5551_02785 [Syntrophales bacterium]|jgi:hypothetical protein|nr:hypothetical protein [Syntrophales bacterium]HRT61276.1 hypothetical protein [Syntrophales bacterium]
MERDELIQRLRDARDPGERAKILEILASFEKEGTSPGNESSGMAPAVKVPSAGVFTGYVVGALFLAAGAWMVYNAFIASSGGLKPAGVFVMSAVGALLVILGALAVFRAGRIRGISKEAHPDIRGQDSGGFQPGP